MTALEILKAARAKVAAGWTQGSYSTKGNCFCAAGAIYFSVDERKAGSRLSRAALLALQSTFAEPYSTNPICSVVHFNDAPGRTQAEVLAAFDRAIALAEAA